MPLAARQRRRRVSSARVLNDGSTWEVFKRYFTARALAAELGGGEVLHDGRWFVVVTRRSVTRRRSTYRSLESLKRDNAVCRACVEAGYPLESLPVIAPRSGQRAYLFGQAPGIVEGDERRPWRGRAGQTLRRWLAMDEDEFYATFYCASVTRCYPGKPRLGPRRPDADARRAAALRVLARTGAAAAAARA